MATQIFTQPLWLISMQFPLPRVRKENSVEFPDCLGCFYILFLSVAWKMAMLGFSDTAVCLLIKLRHHL